MMGSVSRSKSFNSSSLLFSRPHHHPCPPSSLSRSFSRGATKYGYLGQNMGPPSGHSPNSVVKINTNKTTHTIQGLQTGLKGAIRLTQEQIQKNNEELQGQQKSKSLQLQLKTLEYQLSRLESLEEEYSLQQKLREGVRSMAYAYTLSTGNHQKTALANVKAGFRECTEILSNLEGQLQEFLGAFHLTMKGVQGFARLCPGDVYEITVKHDIQKWKTRTKVTKDGSQEWDFPQAKFRAILGQELYIKASEVKTLGKQVLLGNKFCEICELFSAHPQLMTVNLNPSGSLKLNVIVEWQPLAQFYAQDMDSPLRKRRMVISPTVLKKSFTSSSSSNNSSLSIKYKRRDQLVLEEGQSIPEGVVVAEDLRENLAKLASILNDEMQGQYPELEMCEVNIAALRRIAFQESYHRGRSRSSNKDDRRRRFNSSSSLNIESALEAFDFLDNCEVNSPPPLLRHQHNPNLDIGIFSLEDAKQRPISPPVSKPRSHLRNGTATTDSGISSLTSNSSRSPSPSEAKLVTGSEQLDLVLNTHVLICLKLVNNIGAFGPLKWKERKALSKLQQQGTILGNILNRIHEKDDYHYLFELEGLPFIQKLWIEITQSSSTLCTTSDQVAYGLEREIYKFHDNSHHLSKSLVMHMLYENDAGVSFQRHAIVTLFQFIHFLKPYQTSFQRLVNDIAEEEQMVEKLKTPTPTALKEVIQEVGPNSVPSLPLFLPLVNLLNQNDQEAQTRQIVTKYLLTIGETRRREVLDNALALLESEDGSVRSSCLELLNLVGGREVLEEVAYLAQTDGDPTVREAAKKLLLSQKEGGRMHAQLTLNSHGFQGLLAN